MTEDRTATAREVDAITARLADRWAGLLERLTDRK